MNQIQTRHVPERQLLTITGHVHQPELAAFLHKSMTDLSSALEKAGVVAEPPGFAVYNGPVSESADGPVEVCMAFEGDLEAPKKMEVRAEPEYQEIYTTLTRAECEYPRILDAYGALSDYVRTNNFAEAGSPREIYVADFDSIGPNDVFIELAQPIRAIPALAGAQRMSWPDE